MSKPVTGKRREKKRIKKRKNVRTQEKKEKGTKTEKERMTEGRTNHVQGKDIRRWSECSFLTLSGAGYF